MGLEWVVVVYEAYNETLDQVIGPFTDVKQAMKIADQIDHEPTDLYGTVLDLHRVANG